MKNLILQQITPEDLIDLLASRLELILREKFPQQEHQEYLTRRETAKLLSISLVTLNEWSKKGILQSYRIGGRVRYKKSEIDHALREVRNLKYRRVK